jgi:putative peptidoglycan lipid II flippase
MYEAVTGRCRRGFSRWKELADSSVNRRIFSVAVIVALGTIAVKLVAIPKEVMVAYRFGVGDALDAFLVAFLIPSFAINVVANSFYAAFIPAFVRVRDQQGAAAANRLFATVLLVTFVLLVVVAATLAFAGPWLLSPVVTAFAAQKRALTLDLFYWLLPVTVIHGLVVLCAAVLNASQRFGLAALTPAATPLAVIAFLLAGASAWGVHVVAWGTLAGTLVELAVLAAALGRKGIHPIPRWHGVTEPLRRVMGQYLPIVAAAFVTCSTLIVDQGMAAWLAPGSVAALNFGSKIPTLLTSVGAIALGNAVLPHFSSLVAAADYDGIRHTLKSYLVLILVATVPITLACIIASEFLVRLLFERGAFSEADTLLVARVQAFYFLTFPAYIACILGSRLLSALSKNHVMVIGSLLNFTVTVVGNYVLMQYFGVAGIALSTAIVLTVSATYIFLVLRYLLRAAPAG